MTRKANLLAVAAAAGVAGCGGTASAAPASTTKTEAPATTAEGWDRVIPPAEDTASWLRRYVSDRLDDRSDSSTRVTAVNCLNTDHGSSKCSLSYTDETGEHRARLVVHYSEGMPLLDEVSES